MAKRCFGLALQSAFTTAAIIKAYVAYPVTINGQPYCQQIITVSSDTWSVVRYIAINDNELKPKIYDEATMSLLGTIKCTVWSGLILSREQCP